MNSRELRAFVDGLYRRIDSATYYELLGVDRDADVPTIKKAFREKARVLHADRHKDIDIDADLRDRMERVLGELSRAQATLSDEGEREEYDARLKLESRGVPTDVRKIFTADQAFRAGQQLVNAAKYDAALEKLNEAIRLNPSEPDYHAFHGWCRYCLLPKREDGTPRAPSEGVAIRNELLAVAKENEKCASVYVFLGHIARTEGHVDVAREYYQHANEIDPQNREAQTYLRFLNRRSQNKKKGFFAKLFGKG